MPHLKLKDAWICIDCETISNHSDYCLDCTSRAMYPLAGFLDRDAKQAVTVTHELMSMVDQVTDGRREQA